MSLSPPGLLLPMWPTFDQEIVDAVGQVLRSGKCNYWTGEEGKSFEREFSRFIGTTHAVAVSSGSAALECALQGLGIGQGDEVVVTCRSFIASVSAVVMRGATPVFADVDRETQGLSAATVERVLTPRTKAILPVHIGGWSCEMDGILDLARARKLVVIEDVAQSLGARYRGRVLGSLGDAAAFSFCQDKVMTTGGEGGMVTTESHDVWKRAWAFKDHGKDYDTVFNKSHPPGYRWLHESFGPNLRMTEMQAAIGRVGMRRLSDWIGLRRRNAKVLTTFLDDQPAISIPKAPPHIEPIYYRYYVFVRPEALRTGYSRDTIMNELAAQGIPCFAGYGEMYMEKAFANTPYRPFERLSVARELAETSLFFLVHPTLTEEHMAMIGERAREVLRRASR